MEKDSPYSYELEGTLLVMVEEYMGKTMWSNDISSLDIQTSPYFEPIISCEEKPSSREGSLWTSTSNTSSPFVTEDIEDKGVEWIDKSSAVVMETTHLISSWNISS